MPIYEYTCECCQEKFDLMRSMSQSDSPAECPSCKKSDRVRRRVSRVAAFSRGSDGGVSSGGGGGCGGCSSTNCSTCGV